MNKKYIPGVIVVEGKHDASKLSLIYDSVFVITNGYELPKGEIAFLNSLKDTEIIILVDNDEAGKKIREKINQVVENVINIEISAPIESKKKGVAECRLSDIQKELDKYVTNKKESDEIDLYKLGLIGKDNSKDVRNIISNQFNLYTINPKQMIKRLELLGTKEEDIKLVIENEASK